MEASESELRELLASILLCPPQDAACVCTMQRCVTAATAGLHEARPPHAAVLRHYRCVAVLFKCLGHKRAVYGACKDEYCVILLVQSQQQTLKLANHRWMVRTTCVLVVARTVVAVRYQTIKPFNLIRDCLLQLYLVRFTLRHASYILRTT